MHLARIQIKPSEAARVVKDDPAFRCIGRRTICLFTAHRQHNMIMLAAWWLRLMDADRSRHAKMQQHCLVLIQWQQHIFAAPLQAGDTPSLKAAGKPVWQGPAQIRPANMRMQDMPPLHHWCQRPPDCLHLWQFRHRQTSCAASCSTSLWIGLRP